MSGVSCPYCGDQKCPRLMRSSNGGGYQEPIRRVAFFSGPGAGSPSPWLHNPTRRSLHAVRVSSTSCVRVFRALEASAGRVNSRYDGHCLLFCVFRHDRSVKKFPKYVRLKRCMVVFP